MISKMSTWYAVYRHMLEKQEERRKDRKIFGDNRVVPMPFPNRSKGPGKYRTRKEESDDHDWGKTKRENMDAPAAHSSALKYFERVAVYGDQYKTLPISEPNGAAGKLHVSIDRYHQGMISKVNNEWVAHLNERSEITGDDILIMVEMIEVVERAVPRTGVEPVIHQPIPSLLGT